MSGAVIHKGWPVIATRGGKSGVWVRNPKGHCEGRPGLSGILHSGSEESPARTFSFSGQSHHCPEW